MKRATLALGAVGGLVGAAGLWSLYQRRTTETVPYEVVDRLGDVELRRYPPTVLVETVAADENEAFGRLFRYISGANEGSEELAMTAPVEVDPPNGRGDGGDGLPIPMTAPVEVGEADGPVSQPDIMGAADGSEAETGDTEADPDLDPSGAGGERMALSGRRVRMGFYLPPEYDAETAPRPTHDAVEVVAVPARTLAVRRFGGRATDGRVRRRTALLLEAVDASGLTPAGEPFYMGYDAPWTLPFLRRNEVAVEIEDGE